MACCCVRREDTEATELQPGAVNEDGTRAAADRNGKIEEEVSANASDEAVVEGSEG